MIPDFLIRPLLYAAIGLILVSAGFTVGALYMSGKWKDAEAARAVQAVKIVTRQGEVTERVVVRWKERQAATRTVTETIEKEVVRYVPASADFMLPLGWRLLHDAAALGQVPQAPPGADVAAPSVAATAAAATVINNYGAAHMCIAQLEELQGWVREQYETTNMEPLRWVAPP